MGPIASQGVPEFLRKSKATCGFPGEKGSKPPVSVATNDFTSVIHSSR